MAQLFRATPVLPNVNISVLEAFFDCWTKLHDVSKLKEPSVIEAVGLDDFDVMIDGIRKRQQIKSECWRELASKLEPNIVSEITALFYFHNENKYSERFQKIYEIHYLEIETYHEKYPEQYRAAVFHILDKTSGLNNILHSLYVLGQVDFAEALYKRYDLDGCFAWLPEMRNKSDALAKIKDLTAPKVSAAPTKKQI